MNIGLYTNDLKLKNHYKNNIYIIENIKNIKNEKLDIILIYNVDIPEEIYYKIIGNKIDIIYVVDYSKVYDFNFGIRKRIILKGDKIKAFNSLIKIFNKATLLNSSLDFFYKLLNREIYLYVGKDVDYLPAKDNIFFHFLGSDYMLNEIRNIADQFTKDRNIGIEINISEMSEKYMAIYYN